MAVVIDLQGEFGWEIRPKNVAAKLARVDGEDVIVRLSSIGGDVFDGADVVNLFIDFRRDNPSIKMNLEIKAIAASYGSALMAAPIWDDIGISQVSAVMIHKASRFAYVNADDALELIKFLGGLDTMYSKMYSERTGRSQDQMLSEMKDETWYFGQAIIDAGFANRIITMDDEGGEQLPLLDNETDRSIFIVDFKNQQDALMSKLREKTKDERFDVKRAAAVLREPAQEQIIETPGKPDEIKPVLTGNNHTEELDVKTKAELMSELPEVYNESVQDGVMKEREENKARMVALNEMKKDEDYKDLPEVIAVIDEAIMGTGDVNTVLPKINIAVMKIMKDPARMAALESPADIGGGDGEEPAPAVTTKEQAEV